MNEIRFYRATGPHGFLSNLYPVGVVLGGRWFTCAEAAYQFGKPKDHVVAEWIVSAPKPHLIAMAGHALFAFDIVPNWNDIKVERMKAALRMKFTQNVGMKKALLDTGDAILIEDSSTDAFWGIGKNGKGQNMLGHLLMEVREEVKR